MYLQKLNMQNFRNYHFQQVDFINGINLFLGNNAQGKTNIIEAVYLAAFGKSYRTSKYNEMVQFKQDYARVNLTYQREKIPHEIEVYFDQYNKKNIKKDGVKISKISSHVGEVLIVIFSPDSLDIIKGSPEKRRNFLDMICCQLSKSYLIIHQEYMKYLKIKNLILKQEEKIDQDYIFVMHDKMSECIEKIVSFRKEVIEKLQKKAEVIEKNITNGAEEIRLHYVTDFLNMSKSEIKKYLDEHLSIDILRKSSIKGIQRDDIEIYINDFEVNKYGSQGQNRTALLTLKLADFEVLKEVKEETPILLLDDIMSELDSNRISFLLSYIEKYQSIITTTDDTFVKNVKNIKITKVKSGRLEF